MAAYAAAVSLMHIIDLIKNHPSPPISPDKQQFDSLTEVVAFLQEFLESYVSPFSNSDEADPLEMRIAEAIYAAEDVIESYIVDNIHLTTATTAQDDDDDYHPFPPISLQSFLEKFKSPAAYSDEADPLEMRIADAAYAAEDVIKNIKLAAASTAQDDDDDDDDDDGDDDDVSYRVESIQLDNAATHYVDEQIRYFNFYEGLEKVIEAMGLIKKEAMEMKMEMVKEKGGLLETELQRNVPVDAGLTSSSTERKSEMVGFDDVRLQLLDKLTGGDSKRRIIPIVGMGGIGKTTLAQNVFDDKLIKEHLDICVWATISLDHDIDRTLREVLTQSKGKEHSSGEKIVAELGEKLRK